MSSIKLRDNIYWIGVKNPELRVFDIIMETKNGTTYNSYLIDDEKVAIVDTVKDGYYEEFISNIKEVIGDRKIDYVIVQHTELDHSGVLAKFTEDYPEVQIICSRAASIYLRDITNKDLNILVAPDTLSLGSTTLKFIQAPNLHWPDTMFTYVEGKKLLLTCDFLGCHYCPKDDIIVGEEEEYDDEMVYYYNVIMSPFKKFVLMGLDKIKNLDFDLVGTSHGPVHSGKNIKKYIDMYISMSTIPNVEENKIEIFYVSAYGNTEVMARYINDRLKEKGISSEVHEITSMGAKGALCAIEGSVGFIIGSPTINQDAVKPVWDVLSEVGAIPNRGKAAAAFGSYGWSGEAVDMMTQRMKSLKLNVTEGLKFKFVPNKEDFKNADEFVENFAALL
ncbi:flavorubredoxin [Clostridium tetanomorphum]|uniref:FprA family A-type flavoprotein n=1 Tax=Clostridium tetanomorphum TaxID=1553 RepID=A0A923IZC3_CLOTT|nr:FprA family A-type flavoprotein [Clostridium tetanomorphum]KAJ52157.1 flavodoxin [Clostridium tetanomorphum DSM 665]MBC2396489.1 FprA family A-type flavoprotein [Clostridium tetanomorphum]MBP1863813.1 flavorubredoxin [Clostridium tetanomorphum]NRS84891.1 flavorubredoxin [Clostridium tetanomorphum]NRZ98107.1 flavorubredoxin [Clostridium tetanomorphum]